ncbi:MAG: hypothetical protein C0407_07740 [Desulfobacca sp.]|nr:hypothetical protein [Desulfobacca sp.]
MIPIDPLYVLLFLEFLLIQTVLIGVLYLKGRKLKSAYLKASQLVRDHQLKQETLQGDEALTEDSALNSTPGGQALPTTDDADKKILELGEIGPDPEDLNKVLNEKVEIILQMKKKIEAMEKKFVDMENEYLILFDQSQKQEQALKAAGVNLDKKDELDF